jgi:hypothetical protein
LIPVIFRRACSACEFGAGLNSVSQGGET